MNTKSAVLGPLTALGLIVCAPAPAGPGDIPEFPLFTQGLVKDNLIFVIDDDRNSFKTNGGRYASPTFPNTAIVAEPVPGGPGTYADSSDPFGFGGFEATSSNAYFRAFALPLTRGGRDWLYEKGRAVESLVPPLRHYAWARNTDRPDNYQPSRTYEPYPSYGGLKFANADPRNTCATPFHHKTPDGAGVLRCDVDPSDPRQDHATDLLSIQEWPIISQRHPSFTPLPPVCGLPLTPQACDDRCPVGKRGPTCSEDCRTSRYDPNELPANQGAPDPLDPNLYCRTNLLTVPVDVRLYPAHYYVPLTDEHPSCATPGTCTFSFSAADIPNYASPPPDPGYCTRSGNTYTCDCANHSSVPGNVAVYQTWERDPTVFSFNGPAGTPGGADPFSGEYFGLELDGACLARIEMRPGRNTYPSGRDFAGEIQNFANFMEYYRNKGQEFLAGIAKAFENVSFLNLGVAWTANSAYERDNSGNIQVSAGGSPVIDYSNITFDYNPGSPDNADLWDWDDDKRRNPSRFLEALYDLPAGFGTKSSSSATTLAYTRTLDELLRDVTSDATAPVQAACQRNIVALTTSRPFGNNVYGVFDSALFPNIAALSGAPPANPRAWANGTPSFEPQFNHDDAIWDGYDYGPPYSDNGIEQNADLALAAFETNLNPNLNAGEVPIDPQCAALPPTVNWRDTPLNCNPNLHVTTSAIFPKGFLDSPTLNNNNGTPYTSVAEFYTVDPVATNSESYWPVLNTSSSLGVSRVTPMHMALNGRGEFYTYTLAEEIEGVIRDLAAGLPSRPGSFAPVAFSEALLGSDTLLFATEVNPASWAGRLRAFELDTTGDLVDGDPSTPTVVDPVWDAAEVLDSRGNPNGAIADRVVLTHDGATGIPFRWTNLTGNQQDDFLAPPATTLAEAEARVPYLRGDRSNEAAGFNFRLRQSRLGDIVNSQPVTVARPTSPWPNADPFGTSTDRYSGFEAAQASRRSAVYVGANDGMLHGFFADTGDEFVGYVPQAVYSTGFDGGGNPRPEQGLHALTERGYGHEFYVDGSPVVRDAYIDVGAGDQWRSVLVGTTRGGGSGVFALDVTDPEAFSEDGSTCPAGSCLAPSDSVLWDFVDPNGGFKYGKPTIGMVGDGSASSRWVVALGNGYNSTNREAQLIVLDLASGSELARITAPPRTLNVANGLAAPTLVDTDSDFVFDRAYAGDIQGQIHAFDLSGDPLTWTHDQILFQTPDRNRPITTQPVVARNPNAATLGNEPNMLVMVGTGQYIAQEDGDPSVSTGGTATTACSPTTGETNPNNCRQLFAVVWDNSQGTPIGPYPRTTANLVEQTISTQVGAGVDANGDPVDLRVIASPNPDPGFNNTGELGCYVQLPVDGERSVTNPSRFGDVVLFNTLIPGNDLCQIGGTGFLMSMDYTSCATEGPIFDSDSDDDVDNTDATAIGVEFDDGAPSGVSTIGNFRFTSSSDGLPQKNLLSTDVATGRISWEELLR